MKLHYPTNPPGTRLQSPAASLLQMLFTVLMGTFSLILLLIFSIRRQEAGDTFFNPLYANLIFCSLFCSAIARPATILQNVVAYDFDARYCTAYVFVLELETVGIPLAVVMLIVERVVYFSCLPLVAPLDSYKYRLSRAWKILLVALPWFVGALVAFVKTFGCLRPIVPFGDVIRRHNATERYYSCHVEEWSQEAQNAGQGLLYSFRSGIPCAYLSVAILVMVVYWNKAKSYVNPSYEPEDEVDSKVVLVGFRMRINSYNAANNSVSHMKEDQNQNHPSENNQESVQNAASGTIVDVAKEVSEDETTPEDNLLAESGKVGGVRRRTGSQGEDATETHESRTTTQQPSNQDENRQNGGVRQRTFSQEITETHDPEPTFQEPLLAEPANKTNATVGIIILLALTCACVSVGGSVMVKFHGWLYESTQWLYFGMEFVAVLLAYCFPEVRQKLCCRNRRYGDQDRREQERKDEEMSNLSTSGYSSTGTSERGGYSP